MGNVIGIDLGTTNSVSVKLTAYRIPYLELILS